jgi:hypothetical protein
MLGRTFRHLPALPPQRLMRAPLPVCVLGGIRSPPGRSPSLQHTTRRALLEGTAKLLLLWRTAAERFGLVPTVLRYLCHVVRLTLRMRLLRRAETTCLKTFSYWYSWRFTLFFTMPHYTHTLPLPPLPHNICGDWILRLVSLLARTDTLLR